MNRDIVFRSTSAFQAALERVGAVHNPALGKAIAATIRQLATSQTLPGPIDTFVMIAFTGRAYVRRASGAARNVWIWYSFGESRLLGITAQNSPPVPLDEDD